LIQSIGEFRLIVFGDSAYCTRECAFLHSRRKARSFKFYLICKARRQVEGGLGTHARRRGPG